VLLTDGLIGDDRQIIGMIQEQLKPGNRVFTFGVGGATNHFLINRLAEVGRGTSEILPIEEKPKAAVEEFFAEINNPVLTNIEVSWLGEGDAPEIYPEFMPDLFDQQPLVLHGKKGDRRNGKLKVTGMIAGGKSYEKIFDVNFDQVQGNGAIAQLWGRAKIKEYMNEMYWAETTEGRNTVTNTALDYRLVSDYTSFVAVSEEVRVDPQEQRFTEDIAVEIPESMELESAAAPLTVAGDQTGAMAPTTETIDDQAGAIAPTTKATNAPMAKNVAPAPQGNKNSKDVPEPGQIIGNLLALLALAFFFWKRRQQKKSAQTLESHPDL
jgi:Ca-activated chloride channel family protein